MTNTTMRRINKLETAAGVGEEMGIGERLRAARLRWQNDPEGAARDSAASMAAMEARARGEGKPLSKMERRILEARRRVDGTGGATE